VVPGEIGSGVSATTDTIAIPGHTPTSPATATSLPALLVGRAAASPDRVAWRRRERGVWTETRWAELEALAASYATGFAARGVVAGDRVAMIVGSGLEAVAATIGLLGMGAVVVLVHPGPPTPEVGALLADLGVEIAVVEDAEQLAAVTAVRGSAPALRETFVVDPRRVATSMSLPPPGLAAVAAATDDGTVVAQWRESVLRLGDGPAVIATTVGGAGALRPVSLTHENLVAAGHALAAAVPVLPDDEILSYLPPSHLLELALSTAVAPLVGAVVNVGDGPTGVVTDLLDVRPTVLLGVPSLWSRLAERFDDDRSRAGRIERRVLARALRRGRGRLDARRRGARAGFRAGGITLRRARARLGLDRARAPLSALAPLPVATADTLGALGIVLRQCYGTAESSGLLTVESADAVQPGSVGAPVLGTEVRIGADDELVARGPQVIRDAQGRDTWLPTGDRAGIDEGSLVHLCGRTEDLIVTGAGVQVDATAVAAALEQLADIRRAVVTGDGRPSIGALLELEPAALAVWAARHSVPRIGRATHDRRDLLRELEERIAAANDTLPQEARVQHFRVLPGPLAPGVELTGTLRLRRSSAARAHVELVDEMYRR
jgi:long-chain acyl-CoA synthetase